MGLAEYMHDEMYSLGIAKISSNACLSCPSRHPRNNFHSDSSSINAVVKDGTVLPISITWRIPVEDPFLEVKIQIKCVYS